MARRAIELNQGRAAQMLRKKAPQMGMLSVNKIDNALKHTLVGKTFNPAARKKVASMVHEKLIDVWSIK